MDTLVKNASETKNRELAGTKERTTRKKWNASKIAAIVTGLAIVGFTFADALNGHGQKDNPNLNPLVIGSGSGGTVECTCEGGTADCDCNSDDDVQNAWQNFWNNVGQWMSNAWNAITTFFDDTFGSMNWFIISPFQPDTINDPWSPYQPHVEIEYGGGVSIPLNSLKFW